jgi:predicted transcriptional regulator/DNA-binding XRE family transcriptional regulator
MAKDRSVYMGPRLKRLRRELGLTQADMATDLDISPSYIALIERNQRPLTADILLRLARTYRMDIADLAGDGGEDYSARVRSVLKDPMFSDIDLPSLEVADIAANFPGVTEALLRLYSSYQQEQLSLADKIAAADAAGDGAGAGAGSDPVAEARRFLAARRNFFPALDDAGEALAEKVKAAGGLASYITQRHGIRVRRMPGHVMMGAQRRYDRHRSEILIDDALDGASQTFQLAEQLSYIELRKLIDAEMATGQFAGQAGGDGGAGDGGAGEVGALLVRRSLASYAAAAIIMPYSAFAKAVEARRYDVEALARQFGTSFEQTAHRMTTLQKPVGKAGAGGGDTQCVPFFFIRVDQAGNVSKRLDGAGFPFARHGGACPLWSVHHAFLTPRTIVTQWLELPDGERFFSIARTVTAGGGAFGAMRVERAVALGCAAEHAHRLVYTQEQPTLRMEDATPIGVSCRLCQRTGCAARSAPPIGRQVLPDDYRRTSEPFGFSDG